jgi:hypothetical protein
VVTAPTEADGSLLVQVCDLSSDLFVERISEMAIDGVVDLDNRLDVLETAVPRSLAGPDAARVDAVGAHHLVDVGDSSVLCVQDV